jgi:hypothetical protein
MSKVIDMKDRFRPPHDVVVWACDCLPDGDAQMFYITPRGCECTECGKIQVFPTGLK